MDNLKECCENVLKNFRRGLIDKDLAHRCAEDTYHWECFEVICGLNHEELSIFQACTKLEELWVYWADFCYRLSSNSEDYISLCGEKIML